MTTDRRHQGLTLFIGLESHLPTGGGVGGGGGAPIMGLNGNGGGPSGRGGIAPEAPGGGGRRGWIGGIGTGIGMEGKGAGGGSGGASGCGGAAADAWCKLLETDGAFKGTAFNLTAFPQPTVMVWPSSS